MLELLSETSVISIRDYDADATYDNSAAAIDDDDDDDAANDEYNDVDQLGHRAKATELHNNEASHH